MKRFQICALLPLVLVMACDDESETPPITPTGTTSTGTTTTGVGGTGGTGGGGGGTAGSGAFDLSDGTWVLQNASNTADTISHDGAVAITSSGDVWIAFAEPLPSPDDADQDIFATVRTGTDFEVATPLTNDTAVQNAFPAIAAEGDELHLVFNGYPAVDNDIFYVHFDGTWGAVSDVTSASEGTPARKDYRPDIAVTPAGDVVVAYLSEAEANPFVADVRVVRLTDGVPAADPVTIIDGGTDGCWVAKIAVDANADLHVVAECGALGAESVYYATNRTGTWASEVLAGGAGESHTAPDLAVGPDGSSLHVVWQNWLACPAGACADIYYVSSAGSAFGTPVAVTSTTDGTEANPHIAVDPLGRPLVVFALGNADDWYDVFVTNSSDGATFIPAVNVTPGTETSDQWMPYGLTFHPQTGLPHLTYTEILGGTDPLDTEVMHAEFVPAD